MPAFLKRKVVWCALALILCAGGIGWWQRGPIQAWYYTRQLASAVGEDRERLAAKIADVGEPALPILFNGMRDPDAVVCGNMQYPLLVMMKNWGLADDRTQALADRLQSNMDTFSQPAQSKVLFLLTSMLQLEGPRPAPPRLTKIVGDVLLAADRKPGLRAATLVLAAELVSSVEPGQWVEEAGAMAERDMKSDDAEVRAAALQLLLREPMRHNKVRLALAIPLLIDPDGTVRRNALLLLAAEKEVAREESLLPLLHDDETEIQFLAETALRKRGLSDDDIEIARMISDREPATRMRVLQHLRRLPDLNIASLLTQMTHDREKAVRSAAVRATAEFPHVDLSNRLRELAARDDSETVRQHASFYLQSRAARVVRP